MTPLENVEAALLQSGIGWVEEFDREHFIVATGMGVAFIFDKNQRLLGTGVLNKTAKLKPLVPHMPALDAELNAKWERYQREA